MVLSKFTKTAAVAAATLLSSSTLITPVNAGDCITADSYTTDDCSGTATSVSMTAPAPTCSGGSPATKSEIMCTNGKVMMKNNVYSDTACANLQGGEGTPVDMTGTCLAGSKYVSCTEGACDSGANQRISSSMVGTVVGVSLTTLGWIFM